MLARETDSSLAAFIARYIPDHATIPWHLTKLIALLERAAREPTLALVSMPPRHGKSVTIAAALAWMVSREPKRLNAYVTYQADLARTQSRRIRRLARDAGVILEHDAQRMDDWRTPHDGGLSSCGITSGLTGKGFGGLLVVDDPISGREEAESLTQRQSVFDGFNDNVFSRMQPGGSLVVVATRWHLDDLIGRLERSVFPKWERLNLPARRDPLTGVPSDDGAPLWPAMYDVDALDRIKGAVGPYGWSSLYQGHPTPKGGAIFREEWVRHWTAPPVEGTWMQSWDCTFKETADGSYVVGQVWCSRGADFFLVDQIRRRMDFAATLDAMRDLSKRYPRAITKLVEDKANGPAVASALQREIPGIRLVAPEGGKESRANAVMALFASGNVYLPPLVSGQWVRDYVTELTTFPFAANDDQVDSTTQYLAHAAPRYAERLRQAMAQFR